MNMTTIELINNIFNACIVPLLGVLTLFIIKLLEKKSQEIQETIDNDLVRKYVEMLIEIVTSCVITTKQTYVDTLKDKNAFDKEAQEEAFSQTYQNVMALLSDEAKRVLSEVYKDLPLLVNQLIEQKVAETKEEK